MAVKSSTTAFLIQITFQNKHYALLISKTLRSDKAIFIGGGEVGAWAVFLILIFFSLLLELHFFTSSLHMAASALFFSNLPPPPKKNVTSQNDCDTA